MARAFKQHLIMWLVLVLLAAGSVLIALWFAGRQPSGPSELPIDTEQQVDRNLPPKIKLSKLVSGLTAPVDIAANGLNDDSRLYIVEQGGLIRIVDKQAIQAKPFLDLSREVLFSGEQGLLGLVFDPDFHANRYLYVNYVEATPQGRRTVVARYRANSEASSVDIDSEKRLLIIGQPYGNHNGGDLNFGPDGFLYIAMGDGGSRGDPEGRAQSPNTLLGKILRIDVHSETAYAIPKNNPFVDQPEFRSEIWSLGWRNPWRFSFDSLTGDMWIGDVGQNAFEEINHEPAGKSGRNYGWRCFEGVESYNSEGCLKRSNYTFPVEVYKHTSGADCGGSVTGGYVYRGQAFPQLDGFYFYADYCHGRLYALDSTAPTYTAHELSDTDLKITTFGVDHQGELYLTDVAGGGLYQLVAE